tara:strand:- start:1429 stop:1602 length:174 start_codon:yes stop_codon:yes gene_type:complete
MSKLAQLVGEIEETLTQERAKQMENAVDENLSEHDRGLTDGWVEALEYVLKQIEVLH